jgi:hypothetical protein
LKAFLCVAVLLGACTALPNPSRDRLEPVAVPPQEEADQQPEGAAQPPQSQGQPSNPSPDEPAGGTVDPPSGQAAGQLFDQRAAQSIVARVGGDLVGAEELLQRMWLRRPGEVRDELQGVVEARLVLLEASRMGIELEPDVVEAELERAYKAMEREIAASGANLGVEEYIRSALGVDVEVHRRLMRREAIVRLLAERGVRCHSLQSERAAVLVLELKDRVSADKVQAELARGGAFAQIAARLEEQGEGEVSRLLIVPSGRSALARVAFATEIGSVGGPIEESSRFLMLLVEERLPAQQGSWKELREEIDRSLKERPVADPEYWQWKAEMQQRYAIELTPFRHILEGTRP